jgi:hypothetical protein
MFIVCLVVWLKLIVAINGSKIADQCYRIIAFMLQKGELLQKSAKCAAFASSGKQLRGGRNKSATKRPERSRAGLRRKATG